MSDGAARFLIVGLTGGTGSGKSAAARRFEERGIPVVDADRVGHEVIAPGGAAEQAVIAAFGPEILECDTINRLKLGKRVFSDAVALDTLNRIVHPVIYAEMLTRCQMLATAGHRVVVIDAALLAEDGERLPWLDRLALVLSPVEMRIQRLVEGRGFTEQEARARVASQTPPERKIPLADWVIVNDGPLPELHRKVDAIVEELRDAVQRAGTDQM